MTTQYDFEKEIFPKLTQAEQASLLIEQQKRDSNKSLGHTSLLFGYRNKKNNFVKVGVFTLAIDTIKEYRNFMEHNAFPKPKLFQEKIKRNSLRKEIYQQEKIYRFLSL